MRLLPLLLAALVALPGGAVGSHMQSYTRLPEHDDLGRSDEPDFARSSVLGVPVENRVIELTLVDGARALPDGAFAGRDRVLAPGCTDDSGRQPSGLCWMHLLVRFAGVPGMSGPWAPGLMGTKSAQVRFLDMRQDTQFTIPVTRVVDLNHKLEDTGARGILAGLDPRWGQKFVAGPTSVWAWFGTWADKNGNGVIDHEQDGDDAGTVSVRNEFRWLGGCLTVNHQPTGATPVCHPLPGSRIAGFVWPGNHHASCGGGTVLGVDPVVGCSYVSADVPGLQAYCLVVLGGLEQLPHAIADLALDVVVVHYCGSTPESLDQSSDAQYGDPLLENPTSVTPDFYFDDRSGEPDVEARQWVAGQAYPMMFYDQSLVGSTVFIAAEGAPFSAHRQTIDLGRARFVDVDHVQSWSPAVEDLLTSRVKPMARTTWLSYREQVVATMNTGSSVGRGAATDTSPVTGPAVASLVDPGYSHEPNHPADRYPGALHAAHGPGDHEGLANDYRGYRPAFRGWFDAQPIRVVTDNLAWQLPEPSGDVLSQCLTCTAGPGFTSGASMLAGPRGPGDHRRGLDPGLWDWVGRAGLWRDTPQRWLEESLQLPALEFLFEFRDAPPDGWVGNVVNATGAFHYRGYRPQECAVHGQPGPHEHAWCHPTRDGMLSDPNDYDNSGGEWRGQCITAQNIATVVLEPRGGVWTVPAVVLRDVETAPPGELGNVQDWTGRADDPLTPQNEAAMPLRLACVDVLTGAFRGADMVLLPLGNLGLEVTATALARIERLDGEVDTVIDVDLFVASGF